MPSDVNIEFARWWNSGAISTTTQQNSEYYKSVYNSAFITFSAGYSIAEKELMDLREQRDELLKLLVRYRNDVLPGNQPYMLTHLVDSAIVKLKNNKRIMTEQEAKKLEVDRVWNYISNGWVCKHCNRDAHTFHVATGHDHTDYEIYWCTCRGNND